MSGLPRDDGLADYACERRRVSIPDGEGGTLRVHLVDDGDPTGRPVVLLHGNPS
jgi:haloalkane dehalogenase